MRYKLTPVHEVSGYNDRPPFMRRLTLEQWMRHAFFTYTFEFVETKQFSAPDENQWRSWQIFHLWDGTGIALAHDVSGPVVYAFGCDHDWKSIEPLVSGRCMHSTQCSKCHLTQTVDSSD